MAFGMSRSVRGFPGLLLPARLTFFSPGPSCASPLMSELMLGIILVGVVEPFAGMSRSGAGSTG
jgi:hypothetical protein